MLGVIRELINKLRYRRWHAEWHDVPIRQRGQHISRQVYNEVKHSLKLVGIARGYESVKHVADMHNVGRSTAYAIKKSATYGEFKGRAIKLDVKQDNTIHYLYVDTK